MGYGKPTKVKHTTPWGLLGGSQPFLWQSPLQLLYTVSIYTWNSSSNFASPVVYSLDLSSTFSCFKVHFICQAIWDPREAFLLKNKSVPGVTLDFFLRKGYMTDWSLSLESPRQKFYVHVFSLEKKALTLSSLKYSIPGSLRGRARACVQVILIVYFCVEVE